MQAKNSTSLPEQVLFYYVHLYFPGAISRYQIKSAQGLVEADIYIDSLKIAIEYDGSYWHGKRLDRDNKKNKIFNDLGIFVIHIRECGLPELDSFNGISIEIKRAQNLAYGNWEHWEIQFVEDTVNYLQKYSRDVGIECSGADLSITQARYKKDLPKIYGQLYLSKVTPSYKDFCGIEFWNHAENDPLLPENIPQDDWAYCTFTCSNNRRFVLPRKYKNFKDQCKANGNVCSECAYGVLCPFLPYCHRYDESTAIECPYVEEKILWAVKNDVSLLDREKGNVALRRWLFYESRTGMKLIELFLSRSEYDGLRAKILKFFHLPYWRIGCAPVHASYTCHTSIPAFTIKDIIMLKYFRKYVYEAKIDIEDLTDPDQITYIRDIK